MGCLDWEENGPFCLPRAPPGSLGRMPSVSRGRGRPPEGKGRIENSVDEKVVGYKSGKK